MANKSEGMQKCITEIKQEITKFGNARENKDDGAADAAFVMVLEGLERLVDLTVKEIPPEVQVCIVEKAVPVPVPGVQAAPAASKGSRFIPSFLRKGR